MSKLHDPWVTSPVFWGGALERVVGNVVPYRFARGQAAVEHPALFGYVARRGMDQPYVARRGMDQPYVGRRGIAKPYMLRSVPLKRANVSTLHPPGVYLMVVLLVLLVVLFVVMLLLLAAQIRVSRQL